MHFELIGTTLSALFFLYFLQFLITYLTQFVIGTFDPLCYWNISEYQNTILKFWN